MRRILFGMVLTALTSGTVVNVEAAAVTPGPRPNAELQAICRMVDQVAAANHLSSAFLTRILWQESRFRNDATSPAGAEGVAQFMPPTALDRGLANPRDPGPAIVEAGRMLAEFTVQFGNSGLAAAAYNAGAGRIKKWLHRESNLPTETRLYVRLVTGRRVEDWAAGAAGGQALPGADRAACSETIPQMAPAAAAPARLAPDPWGVQLDRMLARAVSLTADRGRRSSEMPPSFRAAGALCDAIRTLGAHCVVYPP
jgi:hypothetical protein